MKQSKFFFPYSQTPADMDTNNCKWILTSLLWLLKRETLIDLNFWGTAQWIRNSEAMFLNPWIPTFGARSLKYPALLWNHMSGIAMPCIKITCYLFSSDSGFYLICALIQIHYIFRPKPFTCHKAPSWYCCLSFLPKKWWERTAVWTLYQCSDAYQQHWELPRIHIYTVTEV